MKLQYYELLRWEEENPPFSQSEQPNSDFVDRPIQEFFRVLPERKQAWDQLILKKLPLPYDHYPILWERIKAMGYRAIPVMLPAPEGDFRQEGEKVIAAIKEKMTADFAKNWDKQREEKYLQPMARLQERTPLTADNYRSILRDLMNLNRLHEAEELCHEVIGTLVPEEAAAAHLQLGILKSHRYNLAAFSEFESALADRSIARTATLTALEFASLMGEEQQLHTWLDKYINLIRSELPQ